MIDPNTFVRRDEENSSVRYAFPPVLKRTSVLVSSSHLTRVDSYNKEILRNILGYKPSVGAAVAAIAFYLVSTLLLHVSFFRTFRGHKFMIVLLLGMDGEPLESTGLRSGCCSRLTLFSLLGVTAMIAGFVFRILYSNNLTKVGFYLPMILCILLSVRGLFSCFTIDVHRRR